MQVHRCPECGNRLTTNYCDICMRRVPFVGMRGKVGNDPWDYSSAHRQEKDHECVSFDTPKPTPTKPIFPKPSRQTGEMKKVMAIILAAISFLGFIGGLISDFNADTVPTPEYNPEAYIQESELSVVQPTMLYDDGEISVTVDSLGLYYEEPSLSLLVENSSQRDIHVLINQMAVNGCMVNAGMSVEVPANESCQGFAILYRQELEEADIREIAWVDLQLLIYDQENYDEIAYIDTVRVETELAGTYVRPAAPEGWEILRETDLSARLLHLQMPDSQSCEMTLFLENLSEDTVYFYSTAIYVNDQESDGSFWISLLPGTCSLEQVYVDGLSQVDIDDLSEITEIELEYHIEYSCGGELRDYLTGSVLFNPNDLPKTE